MLSIRFIFIPLLKLLHILKPIGIKESSAIIQNHFADIKDKLINVIELAEIKDPSYSSDILLASIDQKINDLSIFDFNKAVEYKNLRHILTYFIVSLLITITIFFVNRSVFTAAPQRIMHYNTNYVKPAPFDFHLNNATLEAKKGDPYIIRLECTGEELPQVVYINIEGHNYLMKSKSPGHFEFEMASVINPVTFYFTDLKYKSDQYKLQLLPKPGINHFNVSVHPPDYTGLSDVRHSNVGDLQVPNGTRWNGISVG